MKAEVNYESCKANDLSGASVLCLHYQRFKHQIEYRVRPIKGVGDNLFLKKNLNHKFMKKNFNYFVGVDVSKEKLDISILDGEGSFMFHQEVENTEKQISTFLESLLKQLKTTFPQVVFCLEHTGVYGFPLCSTLSEKNINYALVPANEIKLSTGIKRGKNDKSDSIMIAEYAYLRCNKLILYKLPSKRLQALKILLSRRDLLVNQIKGLKNTTKETKQFIDNEYIKSCDDRMFVLIKSIDLEVKALEKEIIGIVKGDEVLNKLYDLITSVVGVGLVTALHLIVATNAFTSFENSKQLATYCGVAPFEKSSGKCLKGRAKVSPYANKKIKSLLTMVVMNAIKTDKELKAYYERKQKEGDNNMLIFNNIKNKVLGRIVAVVKRGTPYVLLYNHIN